MKMANFVLQTQVRYGIITAMLRRRRQFAVLFLLPLCLAAQRGGTNPDGSLRPGRAVSGLFSQDAYTEYSILEPGSEQFRIRFLPEQNRAGSTELVNATRG